MTKRVTKRERFTRLLEVVATSEVSDAEELSDFISSEIGLLDKKAASRKGQRSKTQIENDSHKLNIVAALDEPKRAGALAKELDLSTQKVTALLRQLVKAGEVGRHTDDETKAVVFMRYE